MPGPSANGLKRENQALREQLDSFQGHVRIITDEARMQKLLEMARQVGPTGCNALITGESGTGQGAVCALPARTWWSSGWPIRGCELWRLQ